MKERDITSSAENRFTPCNRDESCRSAHVPVAFSGMRNEDIFKKRMPIASKIPMQDFIGILRQRQQKIWREL
eukprot:1137886-Pelagomonas_calceolata.AAC.2